MGVFQSPCGYVIGPRKFPLGFRRSRPYGGCTGICLHRTPEGPTPLEPWRHRLPRELNKITFTTHLLSYKEACYQDFQMTVENANAFLDELKANGPNAKLMSKIGKDFQPEHMKEALKAKEINEAYEYFRKKFGEKE